MAKVSEVAMRSVAAMRVLRWTLGEQHPLRANQPVPASGDAMTIGGVWLTLTTGPSICFLPFSSVTSANFRVTGPVKAFVTRRSYSTCTLPSSPFTKYAELSCLIIKAVVGTLRRSMFAAETTPKSATALRTINSERRFTDRTDIYPLLALCYHVFGTFQ